MNLGNNNILTFLIDTGADISLCKVDRLNEEKLIVNVNKSCSFSGITTEKIQSLGTSKLNFIIYDQKNDHDFHIVDENFPIPTDGILGRDFFAKFLCKIDYETFTITLTIKNEEVTIPMKSSISRNFYIKVEKRSELIYPINLELFEDSVVLNKEIQPGIFISNTIVPGNGICHIKILNTTDNDVLLENIELDVEPLKNYVFVTKSKNNTNRFEKLLEALKMDINDNKAKEDLCKIFRDYQHIFHLEGEQLTANNFYSQHIQVSDKTPVYIKNYRLPHSQYDEINHQVEELLQNDIIEHSNSAYNSPLLIVPKHSENGKEKWRLVVDFRQLNKKVVNDKFPLTRLDDVLDRLGRAKYFSTLDMTSSFHQINLDNSSKHLTAFSTNNGHYQFKRLPFGLKISSNSFQRMLTIALSGLDASAFLYVDDIIVFGCSLKHHNENLRNVFERLSKYNLKLNAKKCVFLKPEVIYLGHQITKNGIKTDPAKHKIIENYPVPKDAEEIKRFVAFCNYYRRFIKNFAEITKCLNDQTKKGKVFEWTTECQQSFESLKKKLVNSPILQYPDFDKPFILTTDASNYALGAILSQGEIGKDLPISYASKTLGKHDLNKPVIEKELLAIYWGIEFFRPYLVGRKFIVVTDHRPLVSLFTHKNPSSKLTRIRVELSDHDFEIVYKKGKMNTNADALSRIKLDSDILKTMIPIENDESKPSKILAITRSMRTKETHYEEKEKDISQPNIEQHIWECTSLQDIKNIRELKYNVMASKNNIRNGPKEGTIEFIDNSCVMTINDNLAKYVLSLEKLVVYLHKQNVKNLALSCDDEIFKFISIDYLKDTYNEVYRKIKKSCKYRNFDLNIILYKPLKRVKNLKVQQKLIEEFHNSPISGHFGVRKTVLKLKQRYIWKNMRKMVRDYVKNCDKCLRNKQTKNIKEEMIITDTPTTSFEIVEIDTVGPLRLSNGYRYILTMQCNLTKYVVAYPIETKEAKNVAKTLVEQFILKYGCFKVLKSDNGTEFKNELMNEICKLLNIEQKFSAPYHHQTIGTLERNHRVMNEYMLNFVDDSNWDQWIPYYTFAYNTTPHVDNNYTPYELVFGKLTYLPIDEISHKNKIYNLENYYNELRIRLRNSLENAKKYINMAKEKSKIIYDKNILNNNFNIGDLVLVKYESRKKNQSPYHGPYEIIRKENVNSYLNINDKEKMFHNNSLKLYKKKTN